MLVIAFWERLMYIRVADWLKAIVFAVIILLVYLFIGRIQHTILLFIAAGIIVFLINPIITFLLKRKVPRSLAIVMTYILFFGIIVLVMSLTGPVIAKEFRSFLSNLPKYISSLKTQARYIQDFLRGLRISPALGINPTTLINQTIGLATSQIRNLVSIIPSLISLFTDIFLTLFISIYMLVFLPVIDRSIRKGLSASLIAIYDKFLDTMKSAFSRYLVGQLAFMSTVGVAAGVAVSIVGLPFPALFGLWAALTEIIPVVGPILGAIPAIIVALTIKPILALWVVIAFIVIQQLENYVLAPFILGGTVGLNPLLIIFSIIAGGELAGIVGIFLAVPTLVVIVNIIKFILDNFSYERIEEAPDRIVIKK